MRGTGSVTEVVPEPADNVFAFLTDVEIKAMGTSWKSRSKVQECDPQQRVFAYRSCTDDGNPSYAIWRWHRTPREGGDAHGD